MPQRPRAAQADVRHSNITVAGLSSSSSIPLFPLEED